MLQLVVIDFETTGLVPGEDEVLQVAILQEDGNVLLNEYCCPARHTHWEDAQKIHGIRPQDVREKESFENFVPQVRQILQNAKAVVAYNIPFERSFLEAYGISSDELTWAPDPMETFAELWGGQKRTLKAAAEFWGYTFSAHDALEDVRATLFLYKRMEAGGGLINLILQESETVHEAGEAYQRFSEEGMLRLLKALRLCPATAKKPKLLVYSGIDTQVPVPCEIYGVQNRSQAGDWLVLLIRFGNQTGKISDDCLRDMQTAASGASMQKPAETETGERKRRSPKAAAPGPAKRQAGNTLYQRFAKKEAAVKNVTANMNANPENPFYDKRVVFTGDLQMEREEAAQAVAELGAQVKSSVSAKTDFLVIGVQDEGLVGSSGMSGKERKAQELNESGKGHIRCLQEKEFLTLLHEARSMEKTDKATS